MSKTWGTTCGVWGDVIVNYGYFLDRIKEGKLLYLGNNDQIVEFLKCQPNVKDVIKVLCLHGISPPRWFCFCGLR